MDKKTQKLIFALSSNARSTTKALGHMLRTSQQSVSYQIKQLTQKKQLLGYVLLADPATLGLVNVFVGFNLRDQSKKSKMEVLDTLLVRKEIVAVYEGSIGLDLLVEFCTPNLSAFSKLHHQIIHNLHKLLETRFINPVIVKHRYPETYLIDKRNTNSIVLCGDRSRQQLTAEEHSTLSALVRFPDHSLVSLAKETGLSVKTVMTAKRHLEEHKIIRGYSCIFNLETLGIRRYHIFIDLKPEGILDLDKLIEFARLHKNITAADKIIGPYQVMLTAEESEKTLLLKELRTQFPIRNYIIVEIEHIHKLTYLPVPLPE